MQDYFADEIGVLSPNQMQVEELYAGEVSIISSLAKVKKCCTYHGYLITVQTYGSSA